MNDYEARGVLVETMQTPPGGELPRYEIRTTLGVERRKRDLGPVRPNGDSNVNYTTASHA